MNFGERESGAIFFVNGPNLNCSRVRNERARDDAGAVTKGMHAEELMRRLMNKPNQAVQLVVGQQHALPLFCAHNARRYLSFLSLALSALASDFASPEVKS